MMDFVTKYDVIVVGGGHAGTEAALAAARMGAKTLLLTHNIETLGQMSCNPAIGGIGKGHLVKEIDALGGIMARAIDRAGIQFRILNASKGVAVQATRAQADRILYRQAIRHSLENQPNLVLFQQAVDDLILASDQVCGVVTQVGLRFEAKTVVLTTGTFLNGQIHIGQNHYRGGRAGDAPAISLAQRLRELSLPVGRLKTGTPPRIDGRTIDYSVLAMQPGDEPTPVFSFLGTRAEHPRQVPCYIAHTNAVVHDIIRERLSESPMYSGKIEGVGPRYCPSIEDKVVRFSEKTSHQIFVEPEGLNVNEIYPNGISTSLSFETQLTFVRAIKGFERAHITRPGYAIEYDYFDPRNLNYSLETKSIRGLFFAGQINGTTGYEEAAAQGLIAGINAALQAKDCDPWYPRRDQAYIGVLLDDLITKGTQEPYRMFTSRAEYRLLLREDNADLRLTEEGWRLGLIDEIRWRALNTKQEAIARENEYLRKTIAHPTASYHQELTTILGQPLAHEMNLLDLLRRPAVGYAQLRQIGEFGLPELDEVVTQQIEIQAKYAGYIKRQALEIERLKRHEATKIPAKMNYQTIPGLSTEIIQKLMAIRPSTLGQAARIEGMTPAALSIVLIFLKKQMTTLTD